MPLSIRLSVIVFLLIATVALIRMVDSARYMAPTSDEYAHIYTGMEWLELKRYQFEELHPPLTRIIVALPLYIQGVRLLEADRNYQCESDWLSYFNRIYHDPRTGWMWVGSRCLKLDTNGWFYNERVKEWLAWGRAGNLPWTVLMLLYTYLLGTYFGTRTHGLIACCIASLTPALLAHGSLATTDMGATVAVLMMLYHLLRWLDSRAWRDVGWLGVAFAVACLTKFSAAAYGGVLVAVTLLVVAYIRRNSGKPGVFRLHSFMHGLVAAAISALLIWACYRFSIGIPTEASATAAAYAKSHPDSLLSHLLNMRLLPAPEWFTGWEYLWLKQAKGHAAYLFGKTLPDTGVWYFFPVALFYKTPTALLLLLCAGIAAVCLRKSPMVLPLLWFICLMALSMLSKINIGVRHILVIYPFIALIAAGGIIAMIQGGKTFLLSAAIASIGLIHASFQSHPDYLPYFNLLARSKPEHILVDSDLDWGQDTYRIAEEVKKRGITHINVCGMIGPKIRYIMPVPVDPTCADGPRPGWMAIGFTRLYYIDAERMAWLRNYTPVARVGSSMYLYYFP
jgi:hypothetical protein